MSLLAWASWSGYRQNRGRNDEWPINLAILGVSAVCIVALIVSLVL